MMFEDTQSDTYTATMPMSMPEQAIPSWTFLTNHAHVLIALSRNPDLRQKDIAYSVGITVGAVHRILHELEDAGYLTSERVGRRKHYDINTAMPMRHPLEDEHSVNDLILSLEQ